MVVMLFAWSVDYIDRFAISMALPSIGTEFALSKSAQGWLVTVFALVYMVCQIPAGYLADRYGSRRPMLVTLVLWSVTALTGMAGTFGPLLMALGWRHTFLWMAGCGAAIGVAVWAILPRALPARLSSSTASSTTGPGGSSRASRW